MTSAQLLVERITKIARSHASFSKAHEENTKTELKEAYREYASERGFNSQFEIRGMRDGLLALVPDSHPDSYFITESGEQNQHPLRIWVMRGKIQIDIMNRKGVKIAQSLGKAILAKGVEVSFATHEEIARAAQAYLAASRDIGIH